jgi:hypothetical protein
MTAQTALPSHVAKLIVDLRAVTKTSPRRAEPAFVAGWRQKMGELLEPKSWSPERPNAIDLLVEQYSPAEPPEFRRTIRSMAEHSLDYFIGPKSVSTNGYDAACRAIEAVVETYDRERLALLRARFNRGEDLPWQSLLPLEPEEIPQRFIERDFAGCGGHLRYTEYDHEDAVTRTLVQQPYYRLEPGEDIKWSAVRDAFFADVPPETLILTESRKVVGRVKDVVGWLGEPLPGSNMYLERTDR